MSDRLFSWSIGVACICAAVALGGLVLTFVGDFYDLWSPERLWTEWWGFRISLAAVLCMMVIGFLCAVGALVEMCRDR
jgi:hypothetical protein